MAGVEFEDFHLKTDSPTRVTKNEDGGAGWWMAVHQRK